ncbi:transducin beta-like protein 2 isoform X1 [Dromiciops gliroides]|uniref:transducin beta-like protein 2 isoform X1 n=2 Tax=Dromiciops gliroides TaxID=33562 RepID=UPI001CC82314|nr:transducin beta-like protein 2 isoform X1 [Dromiciops gliroides]
MEVTQMLVVLLLFGLLALLIVALAAQGRKQWNKKSRSHRDDGKSNGISFHKCQVHKKQKQRHRKEKPHQHIFIHALQAAVLKSHGGNVTSMDFSNNGKYLATCADDRTIHIWSTKDFLQREHRSLRVNVKLDHATLVRFSPDYRALVTWLANADTIRIFKMSKKEDGSNSFQPIADDFPKRHKAPVINIGIAETGKFIMSVSSDTTIIIWTLKGEVLSIINTNQMNNTYAVISPCSRFVGSCGFTPDAKVWEVCFSKSGQFREVARAFELKGHTAGIHYLAFSSDSCRMATISKDGTWKLWATDVEYKLQQDPYLLLTGLYDEAATMPCILALSPDAQVLALASSNNIRLYNTKRGEEEENFYKVHGERVAEMTFDTTGRFLASCGDKVVRVFHNTTGQRAIVEEIRGLLKRAPTETTRQRLNQQLIQAQATLKKLGAVKV